jgi:hypothetical protein
LSCIFGLPATNGYCCEHIYDRLCTYTILAVAPRRQARCPWRPLAATRMSRPPNRDATSTGNSGFAYTCTLLRRPAAKKGSPADEGAGGSFALVSDW